MAVKRIDDESYQVKLGGQPLNAVRDPSLPHPDDAKETARTIVREAVEFLFAQAEKMPKGSGVEGIGGAEGALRGNAVGLQAALEEI